MTITKKAYTISGELYTLEKAIQSRIRLIGFCDIRYPDDRDGTSEERDVRRTAYMKELNRLKLRLCRVHAKLHNAEGDCIHHGVEWWGLTFTELVQCGHNACENAGIPEYIVQQEQQRERDQKHALDMAVEKLEDAQATFKLEILAITDKD